MNEYKVIVDKSTVPVGKGKISKRNYTKRAGFQKVKL